MKPYKLRNAAMAGMFVLVLISFAIANVHSLIWVNSEWLVSAILPAVVTEETNRARSAEDLPPLMHNAVLAEAAQMKAEDMATRGYFSHKTPEGLAPWHWFTAAGYRYAHAGENLAVHFTDSAAVVDAWLDSPTHRANVLSDAYTEIGIGTARGTYEGHETVYVVQLFGTPAAPAPRTPLTPPEELVTASNKEPTVPYIDEAPEAAAAVTEAGTVVYESYVATEFPGAVLAEVSPAAGDTGGSLIARVATSPRLLLQILYSVIGLAVVSLLSYTLVFEWRHHHPLQTAYSAGLLTLMVALFFVHSIISRSIIVT